MLTDMDIGAYLGRMNWVDVIVIIALVSGVLKGVRLGLVTQVLVTVSALVGLKLALENCLALRDLLTPYVPFSQSARLVVAFVAIYAVVMVACRIVVGLWRNLTEESAVSWLDSVGGGILSGLRVLVVSAVCLQLISLAPMLPAESVRESLTSELTGPATQAVWRMLPELAKTLKGEIGDTIPAHAV